jgi:predicted outer membrane repeat protein
MRRLLGLLLAGLLTSLGSAAAATWHIEADGSGDVATIADGVTAAAPGDTVLLANGTYSGPGNCDIDVAKSITVRSESGNPNLCTIDCNGTSGDNHFGFNITSLGYPGPVIEALTVREGYWGAGGAIHIYPSGPGACPPTIKGCVFAANHVTSQGGAIYVNSGATPTITDCFFSGNSSEGIAGALSIYSSGSCTVTYCAFDLSSADSQGGAVRASSTTAYFGGCTFEDNSTTTSGGGLYALDCDLTLMNCAFLGNEVTDGGGGGVFIDGGTCAMTGCQSAHNRCRSGAAVSLTGDADVTISGSTFAADSLTGAVDGIISCANSNVSLGLDHNIIAFGKGALAVNCHSLPVSPTVTCCDIYGNEAGDWVNCIAGKNGSGGNFSDDPLFCDMLTSNLQLEDCSPCLAANNTCGVDIGARGTSCACGEATEPATWGAIKAMFRK